MYIALYHACYCGPSGLVVRVWDFRVEGLGFGTCPVSDIVPLDKVLYTCVPLHPGRKMVTGDTCWRGHHATVWHAVEGSRDTLELLHVKKKQK